MNTDKSTSCSAWLTVAGSFRGWTWDTWPGRAPTWCSFARIFAELGEGFVDLAGAFDILRRAGYDGWLIVETDVTQLASPLESALISRKYLASLGL